MTRRGIFCLTLMAVSTEASALQLTPLRGCATDTLALAASPLAATTVDTVAAGVTYRCIVDPRGPWVLHVAAVDLRSPGLAVDAERALGAFLGRETVSAAARRLQGSGEEPLVGINADFFDLRTGEVENNHVVRGDWVKGALRTDSPHDEFDNAHTQFAVDVRGRPLMGRFALEGAARAGSRSLKLVGINFRPPREPGLVLFTPWFARHTPGDTSRRRRGAPPTDPAAAHEPPGDSTARRTVPELRADSARYLSLQATRTAVEVALRRIGRRGDTVLYRAVGGTRVGGGMAIAAHGGVLSGTGAAAMAFVQGAAARGGLVKVVHHLGGWPMAPRAVVGGWPRVVAGGENVAARADTLEGTFPRFSASRHPRSAIGLSADSATLWLVVVDGRRPWSVGMTLRELGDAMLSLGARDAMNLDGGGSSTLWIRGAVVNVPSDPAGERAVGNALFVRRTRR